MSEYLFKAASGTPVAGAAATPDAQPGAAAPAAGSDYDRMATPSAGALATGSQVDWTPMYSDGELQAMDDQAAVANGSNFAAANGLRTVELLEQGGFAREELKPVADLVRQDTPESRVFIAQELRRMNEYMKQDWHSYMRDEKAQAYVLSLRERELQLKRK